MMINGIDKNHIFFIGIEIPTTKTNREQTNKVKTHTNGSNKQNSRNHLRNQ